jgi:hypothetical protein
LPEGDRWVLDQVLWKQFMAKRKLGFNLAIGYPF